MTNDSICHDIRRAILRSATLDPDEAAHLATCSRCAGDLPGLRALGTHLRATASEPPAGLTARTLQTAASALAHNAGRVAWRPVAKALGAALLPLPAIVLATSYVLRALYGILATVLPESLSFYLVLNYAGLLALLAALTYGAIPVLAARQTRFADEVVHG